MSWSGPILVSVRPWARRICLPCNPVCTRRSVGTAVCLPFAGQLVSQLGSAPVSDTLNVVYLGQFPTMLGFTTWADALARSRGPGPPGRSRQLRCLRRSRSPPKTSLADRPRTPAGRTGIEIPRRQNHRNRKFVKPGGVTGSGDWWLHVWAWAGILVTVSYLGCGGAVAGHAGVPAWRCRAGGAGGARVS